MIFSHSCAALGAFTRSVQYATILGISRGEYVRYLKKSIRLALCYAGFADPWNLREAWKAGEAAFLSCAYDVVTDWRSFDKKDRSAFEHILNELSKPDPKRLALDLYEKDAKSHLAADGLERGAIALRFILKTMGCENERETSWGDLENLGELLQIVDDVYDYEDDIAAGDQNCLVTTRRDVYLRRLLDGLNRANCRQLFGRAPSVLTFAIAQARKKGTALLTTSE
jgi:hypothetical protein